MSDMTDHIPDGSKMVALAVIECLEQMLADAKTYPVLEE